MNIRSRTPPNMANMLAAAHHHGADEGRNERVLNDIQSGRFARDWMLENEVNQTSSKLAAKSAGIRSRKSARGSRDDAWIGANKLVDKDKN